MSPNFTFCAPLLLSHFHFPGSKANFRIWNKNDALIYRFGIPPVFFILNLNNVSLTVAWIKQFLYLFSPAGRLRLRCRTLTCLLICERKKPQIVTILFYNTPPPPPPSFFDPGEISVWTKCLKLKVLRWIFLVCYVRIYSHKIAGFIFIFSQV